MAAGGPYEIGDPYFDDDGYVTVEQKLTRGDVVFWRLHAGGWEAFMEGTDIAIYHTGNTVAPTAEEYWDVWETLAEEGA